MDFEARPEPWEDNREGRNRGTVEVSKTKQKLTQVHLPHLQQVNILHEYAINKGSQASPALPWWPDCSMSSPVTIRAYWENSFRVIHIVRIIELLLNMWTCVFCNLLKICIYINHATDLLKAPESATANHYNIDPYEGVLLLVQKDWTDDALPRSIYASCNSRACCVEKNNNNNRWRKAAKAYPPTPPVRMSLLTDKHRKVTMTKRNSPNIYCVTYFKPYNSLSLCKSNGCDWKGNALDVRGESKGKKV